MQRTQRRWAGPGGGFIAGLLIAGLSGAALVACQSTPTPSLVFPTGGLESGAPTPTPVPGSSGLPAASGGGANFPSPSIEVPPPIP